MSWALDLHPAAPREWASEKLILMSRGHCSISAQEGRAAQKLTEGCSPVEPIASRMQGSAARFQGSCKYQTLSFDFRGIAWLSGRQQILMSKGPTLHFLR